MFRLEWSSLFDTEKLLGKQVTMAMIVLDDKGVDEEIECDQGVLGSFERGTGGAGEAKHC